ncbi:unknown [Salmonella phage FelixO1]|uniref:Uncharacterized protein n=1 Tax=Salmonella phage Felix O1 (isolate Felix O1-VT1) TaxID=1283336 RepID=Q6KGF5_BPFO1|nr:unknown [Salmonella phage FelixO1]
MTDTSCLPLETCIVVYIPITLKIPTTIAPILFLKASSSHFIYFSPLKAFSKLSTNSSSIGVSVLPARYLASLKNTFSIMYSLRRDKMSFQKKLPRFFRRIARIVGI